MRLWRRNDGPNPDKCEHFWRVREVPSALEGLGVWKVCDHCSAMRLDVRERTVSHSTEQAGGAIEVPAHLRRVGSPSPVHTARGDGWVQSHARAS